MCSVCVCRLWLGILEWGWKGSVLSTSTLTLTVSLLTGNRQSSISLTQYQSIQVRKGFIQDLQLGGRS